MEYNDILRYSTSISGENIQDNIENIEMHKKYNGKKIIIIPAWTAKN